jgi:hypothetical protein
MLGYRVNFNLPQQQACKKTFVLGETGTHLETVSLIITAYDIVLWLLGTLVWRIGKVVGSRSQWPRGQRRGSEAARLMGLSVRNPP